MRGSYSFWSYIKTAAVYNSFFLIVFNLFFLPSFSDGGETTGMFVLISVLLALVTTLAYAAIKRIFKIGPSWADFLWLYVLSELALLCFMGEPCLFGIIYKLHLTNGNTAVDIALFREKRDYALSVSFLIAAVLGTIQRVLMKNLSKRT